MSNGEITVGEKPLHIIGVVAHLQRQTRPIRAYKRKVLSEYPVTTPEVQALHTRAIRLQNHHRRDYSGIYRPGPIDFGRGLTCGKCLPAQVGRNRQGSGDVA
jgi:hypothetical protein